MPKTSFVQTEPEIDWLMAIVLERLYIKKITRNELADMTHYGYGYIRNRFREHVCEWPADFRKAVFKALGISVKQLPADVRSLIAASIVQN